MNTILIFEISKIKQFELGIPLDPNFMMILSQIEYPPFQHTALLKALI